VAGVIVVKLGERPRARGAASIIKLTPVRDS